MKSNPVSAPSAPVSALSGAAVMRQYFGYQPGQTLSGFAVELKALAPSDRAELEKLAAIQLGVTLKPA